MTAALISTIIGYLVQYGPAGVQVFQGLINGFKQLTAKGKVPTDDELKALALRIMANHNALPPPTV